LNVKNHQSMRVVYLTAGAGGMYCGSCLRDNALAAALVRQGRDVLLWPVYSPIRTDEVDVSADSVVFGGVNVYLQHRWGIARRIPRWISRWLDHPTLLRWAMRGAGSTDPALAAKMMTTLLHGESGPHAGEVASLIEQLRAVDAQLVHLPNAFFVGLARAIKSELGIPVVCTLTGEDVLLDKLNEASRAKVLDLMRARAGDVDAYFSVSSYYTNYAIDAYGIDSKSIRQVPLGISSFIDDASWTRLDHTFTIGYLARICPEKGLHHLIDAFELLMKDGRDCRLEIAGYLGRGDQPYFAALKRRVEAAPWRDRVRFHGEIDRTAKHRLLRSLDVLSVPTTYREPKGLYILEAMSQGVPVVQPSHGSFPELIESTGGGLLVEPNDAESLADGLRTMMDDATLRQSLGAAGRDAIAARHTDEHMARIAWEHFEDIVRGSRKNDAT
jgi:glycosyltransferase involved in cell wall biosynthesis